MSLAVGTRLGHYNVTTLLGEGGMVLRPTTRRCQPDAVCASVLFGRS